jgi:hypothetical protein
VARHEEQPLHYKLSTQPGLWVGPLAIGKFEAHPFRWLPIGVQYPQASLPIPHFIDHLENKGIQPLAQGESTGHVTVSSQSASFEGSRDGLTIEVDARLIIPPG